MSLTEDMVAFAVWLEFTVYKTKLLGWYHFGCDFGN